MDERTEPVVDEGSRMDRPAVRGPFRSKNSGLVSRIEEYECRGTEEFLAGEYRPKVCRVCKVPPDHCLCGAEPDRLRYALAQISLIHRVWGDGMCEGCRNSATLCGYITLINDARG
jgi:hypothetical protein